MQAQAFETRVADIKRRAHGRWTDLLRSLGVDEKILNKRNQPCPLCGGHDRFQYTDKYGEGNYHCRGCGPGGGLKLLQGVQGWDFMTVLQRLEEYVGSMTPMPTDARARSTEPTAGRMQKLAMRIWQEARPVTRGDDVDRYLRQRGLALVDYPDALRCHPALGYYEKTAAGTSRKVAEYPAMLACIQGGDGHMITLHRTYLDNGHKVQQRAAKKVLSSGINGAAVRLVEATDELAIAEGIETALAIHLATGKPVWAALNAGNLEKLWLPDTVRRICIYADNDANADYDGQAAAFALARRLKKAQQITGACQVEVFVPRQAGCDWADVWRSRIENLRTAA
ncbi:zinc-binding protein [Herbaspirillum sp. HC18]|nr:zinc-binding protein [Herbaspirillum sp. HC18]